MDYLAGPWGPLIIFTMRIGDVSLSTMRLLVMTRGERTRAAVLGFVEVLIWVTAAGAAIQNLTSPLHVLGYAGGFATGNWVGIWLEERFPVGMATVQVYSRQVGTGVADALRRMNLGVTAVVGQGLEGPVDIVSTIVLRKLVPGVIQTIEALDPDAFITVYDARVRRRWMRGRGK